MKNKSMLAAMMMLAPLAMMGPMEYENISGGSGQKSDKLPFGKKRFGLKTPPKHSPYFKIMPRERKRTATGKPC